MCLRLQVRVSVKISVGVNVTSPNPYQTLTLTGSATLSSCASSNKLVYSWTLTNSSGITLPLQSSSINPRKYVIPAYTFEAGSSYTG
jgi:hypothetical protein